MRWTQDQLAAHLARRHPPADAAPARRRRRAAKPRFEATENQVHEAVWQHLALRLRPGVVAFHVPNGELRDAVTAAKLTRMGVVAGIPDLAVVIEGRAYFLELKRQRGGRVSPEQRAMHAELIASGAVIAVAKGIDQALGILETWGALLPANRERTAA